MHHFFVYTCVAPPDVRESYMEHQIWYDKAYLESVHPVHLPPKSVSGCIASLRPSTHIVGGFVCSSASPKT